MKDGTTQTESIASSYNRFNDVNILTYDFLKDEVFCNKHALISWCMSNNLIATERKCPTCDISMKLTKCNDRKDELRWECKKYGVKKHRSEISIRKGTWFENSNMTMKGTIASSYWWCEGLTENQIARQLNLATNTIVDWDMFCRETCEVTMENDLATDKLGGPGKVVEIDESKIL